MRLPWPKRSACMQACFANLKYFQGKSRSPRSSAGVMPGRLTIGLLACLLPALLPLTTRPADAQTCGGDYVIQEGETLAQIAQRVYGNSTQWTLIFYANQDRLGSNATLLVPGLAIKLPCLGPLQPNPTTPTGLPPTQQAQPAPAAGFVLSNLVKRLEFLTAEGYTPYADRTLENGGLILDLLNASMKLIEAQTGGSFTYQVSWVNDWSAHLNPLLITRAFDAGMPWTKLDCSDLAALDPASRYKCQKFFFSDPFYEDVTALFVRSDSSIAFQSDDEIVGKTLCRTKGWSTFDLDKKGRGWIKDGKIVLMQPQTPEDCFRMLESGAVDAVVISDLTGRAIAARMGMLARVKASERPLHIETMHAIVAKTHPNARTILYYINSSLAKLRESGEYDKIVARHLDRFWSSLEEKQPSAPEPTAATGSIKRAEKP